MPSVRQHLTALLFGMNPVFPEERATITEQVKIVNKDHVVGSACGLQDRLRIWLQRSTPRSRVGMGPEIKLYFPQSIITLKRRHKLFVVLSDSRQTVAFFPTCSTILLMDVGGEGRSLSQGVEVYLKYLGQWPQVNNGWLRLRGGDSWL